LPHERHGVADDCADFELARATVPVVDSSAREESLPIPWEASPEKEDDLPSMSGDGACSGSGDGARACRL